MTKLNQVIAIEKGVKSRCFAFLTQTYKTFQKPNLFNGMTRTYQKRDEDGEDFSGESSKVQCQTDQLLQDIADNMTGLLDVTAQKDWANCEAKADVVVGERVIIKGAPATYLLFLEKQLNDLKDEISKIPELDSAQNWTVDPATGLFRSEPVNTSKTRKIPKVIVKYEATEHHPAQTELVHMDEVVGSWTTVNFSAACPAPRKAELRKRVELLIDAVKMAREAANETVAKKIPVGERIFNFILS